MWDEYCRQMKQVKVSNSGKMKNNIKVKKNNYGSLRLRFYVGVQRKCMAFMSNVEKKITFINPKVNSITKEWNITKGI